MAINTIITIGRQYGSEGKKIGQILAKEFDIPYYDKALLKEAAKQSGLCEEIFENYDEKPTNSFLYSLVMDPYSLGYNASSFEIPLNQKVFLAAFDTIKNIANKGPCVFVGRCADYALSDYKNTCNIFIYSPMETRISTVSKRLDISTAKAKEIIIKQDKQRASYYNYYTSKKWSDIKSYDLSIDSSKLGIQGTVDLIKEYILKLENNK